ncbi:MAG: hypothetical protein QHH02_07165 [Syntrophomonadaceae bacterium]|nr:hypothetical protein [Syntrophomonadaceae bacterium]
MDERQVKLTAWEVKLVDVFRRDKERRLSTVAAWALLKYAVELENDAYRLEKECGCSSMADLRKELLARSGELKALSHLIFGCK